MNVPVEPREENFFIEPEQHGSSRHYAGFLWNYRLLYQAERRNVRLNIFIIIIFQATFSERTSVYIKMYLPYAEIHGRDRYQSFDGIINGAVN